MKIRISVSAEIEMEAGEQLDDERLKQWDLILARARELEEHRWSEVAKRVPGLKVVFDGDDEEGWKA
jgi:hypothetical protein